MKNGGILHKKLYLMIVGYLLDVYQVKNIVQLK